MSAGRFAAHRGGADRAAGGSAIEAELIHRLRTLPGPAPEAQFRADLRAQLVAITARVVSESSAAGSSTVAARQPRSSALRRLRRPVLALAGASTVLALLLGMAVWMSSGSLPGQSLYGVKRASENVQLSMAGNDVAKGQAYLQLASNRVREAADLLSHPSAMPAGTGVNAAGGRVSPHTASLVTDTLSSADADSVSGMQLLGRAAVSQLSKEPLAKLTSWLPRQRTLMLEVRDRAPAGSLRTRVLASVQLWQRIATRTSQLTKAMGCPCLSLTRADELGPLPCANCGAVPSRPAGGGPATVPAPLPGLGSLTPSAPLPSLSLPALGGSTGSSSGHAAGPALSPPGPSATPPITQPSALPSGQLDGGSISIGPVVLRPSGLPVTLPTVGAGAAPAQPLSLPGVSGS